jgi:outer membrane protein OmpA-like peptidoglycan-associated protein
MRRTWVYLAGGGALLLAGVVGTGVANRSGPDEPETPALAAPNATLPASVASDAPAPPPAVPDGRLAAAEAEIGRLGKALAAAEAENAELRTTLALRDAVLDTLKASVAERDAALADVRGRLAANEVDLACLRGQLAGLQAPADFDQALTAMKLDAVGPSVARIEPAVTTADGGFVTTMEAPASDGPVVEVQFDFASAALTPGGQERAGLAAATLSGMALAEVRVVGHTDRVGHPEANRRLAARRADAVARFLVEAGLPEGIIVTDDGVPEPLNRSVLIFAQAKPTS